MQNKTNGCIFLYLHLHRLDDYGFCREPPLWSLTNSWKILFSHEFMFSVVQLYQVEVEICFQLNATEGLEFGKRASDSSNTGSIVDHLKVI
jgi:hypothetical protein